MQGIVNILTRGRTAKVRKGTSEQGLVNLRSGKRTYAELLVRKNFVRVNVAADFAHVIPAGTEAMKAATHKQPGSRWGAALKVTNEAEAKAACGILDAAAKAAAGDEPKAADKPKPKPKATGTRARARSKKSGVKVVA